jgi:hypothetical protein
MDQVLGKDSASNPVYIIDTNVIDPNFEGPVDNSSPTSPSVNPASSASTDDTSDTGSQFSSGQIAKTRGRKQKIDGLMELMMKKLEAHEDETEEREKRLDRQLAINKRVAEGIDRQLAINERVAERIERQVALNDRQVALNERAAEREDKLVDIMQKLANVFIEKSQ